MRKVGLFSCLLLVAAASPSPDARLKEIIAPVSGAQMKQTVTKLVSFGTRHTLSSQADPERGIGAALTWTEGSSRVSAFPPSGPATRSPASACRPRRECAT
ncbi:hypothetical protein [Sphingomonas daechungensis]|uniref:hypothetical protein n=1 Tax=Sphingomonas daechungensis TaxID=1176646 RepID=UPI001CB8C4F0|nr:hypothetical protein [Sphingomonas daechungensis]